MTENSCKLEDRTILKIYPIKVNLELQRKIFPCRVHGKKETVHNSLIEGEALKEAWVIEDSKKSFGGDLVILMGDESIKSTVSSFLTFSFWTIPTVVWFDLGPV